MNIAEGRLLDLGALKQKPLIIEFSF